MPGQKRLKADDTKTTNDQSTPIKKRRSGARKETATAVIYPIGFTREELERLEKAPVASIEFRKSISSEITHLAYKSVKDFDCLATYFGVVANTYFVRSTYLFPSKQFTPEDKDQFLLKQIDVKTCRTSDGLNAKEALTLMQSRDGLKNMFGERLFKRSLIIGNVSSSDYKERRDQFKTLIEAGGGCVRGTKEYEDLLKRPEDMHDFASIIIVLRRTDLEDVRLNNIFVQRILNSRLPIVTEDSIKNWIREKAGPVSLSMAMETSAKYWRDTHDPQVPLTDEAFDWAAFGKGNRQPEKVFVRKSLQRSHISSSITPLDNNSPCTSNTLDMQDIDREIDINEKNIGRRSKLLDQPEEERDLKASLVFSTGIAPSSEKNKLTSSLPSNIGAEMMVTGSLGLTLALGNLNLNVLDDDTWLETRNPLRKIVNNHRRTFVPTNFPRASRDERINAEYNVDHDSFENFRRALDFLKKQNSDTPAFTFGAHDLMMEVMHSFSINYVPHSFPLSFILHRIAMVKFEQQANLQESACKLIYGLLNHYPTNGDNIRRVYWLKVFSELPADDFRPGKGKVIKDHNIEIRTKSFREKVVNAFTRANDFGCVIRRLLVHLLELDLFCSEFNEKEQSEKTHIDCVDEPMSSTSPPSKPREGLGLPLAALVFIDHNNTRKTSLTRMDREVIMNVVKFMAYHETNHVLVDQCISFITVCFEAMRHVESQRPLRSSTKDGIPDDLRNDFITVLLALRKYEWEADVIRSFFPVKWMKTIAMEEKWVGGSMDAF